MINKYYIIVSICLMCVVISCVGVCVMLDDVTGGGVNYEKHINEYSRGEVMAIGILALVTLLIALMIIPFTVMLLLGDYRKTKFDEESYEKYRKRRI